MRCRWGGSGDVPRIWSALSSVGSSSRARGLPCVSATRRTRTSSARPSPRRSSSRACAASGPRPASTIWGMPSGRKERSPSRAANTIATRSAPSLRAAKSSASADAGSSQWASSTTHSTVLSSAAEVSIDSVATATRNGSTEGPSSSPNATRSARDWGTGRLSRSRITGRSSRCNAANASGASTSRPWVRSTSASPACATRCSRRADLPMPGSPRTTTLPADPCRAPSTSSVRRALSGSRPTSTVRTVLLRAARGTRHFCRGEVARAGDEGGDVRTPPRRQEAPHAHATPLHPAPHRPAALRRGRGARRGRALGGARVLDAAAPGGRVDGLVPVRGRRGGDGRQGSGPGSPRVAGRRPGPGRADPPGGPGDPAAAAGPCAPRLGAGPARRRPAAHQRLQREAWSTRPPACCPAGRRPRTGPP